MRVINRSVLAELLTAEVTSYQNTISGTSGNRSSTPMFPFDSQGMTSY